MMNLMGAAEVTKRLSISKAWLDVLSASDTFPKPVAVLKRGRGWLGEDIDDWAREHHPQIKGQLDGPEVWLEKDDDLVPGQTLFESDRPFSVWSYAASRSQLLLRSRHGGTGINWSFGSVENIQVPYPLQRLDRALCGSERAGPAALHHLFRLLAGLCRCRIDRLAARKSQAAIPACGPRSQLNASVASSGCE